MPKTPLRALRVPDELWRAAQSRARDRNETVSGVVRQALTDYVQAGAEVADPTEADFALQTDCQVLLAQGMLMQRYALSTEDAAASLRREADATGSSLEDTARAVVGGRTSDQVETTALA